MLKNRKIKQTECQYICPRPRKGGSKYSVFLLPQMPEGKHFLYWKTVWTLGVSQQHRLQDPQKLILSLNEAPVIKSLILYLKNLINTFL